MVVQGHGQTSIEAKHHQVLSKVHSENMEGVNGAQTFGAIGDVDRVIQVIHENANDFAESQGHDRQVVTTQTQGRRAQQDAE